MLIAVLNKESKGKMLGIAEDNKQFNELKMSDCDIIYHQNKGKFFDNLNGEGKGWVRTKSQLRDLGEIMA